MTGLRRPKRARKEENCRRSIYVGAPDAVVGTSSAATHNACGGEKARTGHGFSCIEGTVWGADAYMKAKADPSPPFAKSERPGSG